MNRAPGELIDLTDQWTRAFIRGDTTRLSALSTDDFSVVVAGSGQPFQRVLKQVYLQLIPFYHTRSAANEATLVRMFGDVAVVLSRFRFDGTFRGADVSGEFIVTDTWVNRDGAWKLTERISSRPEYQRLPG